MLDDNNIVNKNKVIKQKLNENKSSELIDKNLKTKNKIQKVIDSSDKHSLNSYDELSKSINDKFNCINNKLENFFSSPNDEFNEKNNEEFNEKFKSLINIFDYFDSKTETEHKYNEVQSGTIQENSENFLIKEEFYVKNRKDPVNEIMNGSHSNEHYINNLNMNSDHDHESEVESYGLESDEEMESENDHKDIEKKIFNIDQSEKGEKTYCQHSFSSKFEESLRKLFPFVKVINLLELVDVDLSNIDGIKFRRLKGSGIINDYSFSSQLISKNEKLFEDHIFKIKQAQIKTRKLNQEIKLNFNAINFWKVLGLKPLHGPKNFKILFLVDGSNESFFETARKFLSDIIENYKNCGLGNIEKVNCSKLILNLKYQVTRKNMAGKNEVFNADNIEERRSSAGISKEEQSVNDLGFLDDGIFNVGCFNDNFDIYYQTIQKKMSVLAKALDLNERQKLKKFENLLVEQSEGVNHSILDNRPILVLFATKFNDMVSILQISKLFYEFQQLLKIPNKDFENLNSIKRSQNQEINSNNSIIESFLKVIPVEFFNSSKLPPSHETFNKFSLNLYNSCPNTSKDYVCMAKTLPEKIEFQFSSSPSADLILSEGLYLHLAYQRSIDKNWCVACWTDQWGNMKNLKSWYCPSFIINRESFNNQQFENSVGRKNSFEEVSNEMWATSIKMMSSFNGKTYLILTRTNSMIPDDELYQWKRLSISNNKIPLIVLSVKSNSKFVLDLPESSFPFDNIFKECNNLMRHGLNTNCQREEHESELVDIDKIKFNQKNQYNIVNIREEVYGIILKNSIPLFNEVSRLPLKTGFLAKPLKDSDKKLMIFEVNLLSCPSNLISTNLLKTLLIQLRNLSLYSSIAGVYNDGGKSIVPWHIIAVEKVINTLIHIRVKQPTLKEK
ncbi:Ssn2p ASCRUDRAFT_82257 [Ascoidea rubescens DSM 1968]|uniref:Mediator of RNA polymerase II transcription subunit 13 n=1 Tax=Ascoidea rubescens DSM 1968 TaxID=1344418 RepID=A0A1D2VCH8_9ASCO|nr:hypothetical protein ASCRUDRAFT_82257 [Ascoidea rubescens DSM 1968]ODV59262.1 hypothetical protein ASCRUDRAFT_82257 [Ascoidea rubescens DSM 1968]